MWLQSPQFEAFVLLLFGATISLISQAVAVHLFLRVFGYIRDGVDLDQKGALRAGKEKPSFQIWNGAGSGDI